MTRQEVEKAVKARDELCAFMIDFLNKKSGADFIKIMQRMYPVFFLAQSWLDGEWVKPLSVEEIVKILNSPNFDVMLMHNEKCMRDIATAIHALITRKGE